MDCGDGGHILISKTTADMLIQLSGWEPLLHDLGEVSVKHGDRIHIFNVYTDGFGNPARPSRMPQPSPSETRLSHAGVTRSRSEIQKSIQHGLSTSGIRRSFRAGCSETNWQVRRDSGIASGSSTRMAAMALEQGAPHFPDGAHIDAGYPPLGFLGQLRIRVASFACTATSRVATGIYCPRGGCPCSRASRSRSDTPYDIQRQSRLSVRPRRGWPAIRRRRGAALVCFRPMAAGKWHSCPRINPRRFRPVSVGVRRPAIEAATWIRLVPAGREGDGVY